MKKLLLFIFILVGCSDTSEELDDKVNPFVKVDRLLDNYESFKKIQSIYVYGFMAQVNNDLLLLNNLTDRDISHALADESAEVIIEESVFKFNDACLNRKVRITAKKINKVKSLLIPGYRYALDALLISTVTNSDKNTKNINCLIRVDDN